MTHARDDQGRIIGTMHDFQGWCGRQAGHPGPHARDTTETGADPNQMCGLPVALIGDIENWKPTGFLNVAADQRHVAAKLREVLPTAEERDQATSTFPIRAVTDHAQLSPESRAIIRRALGDQQ